MTRGVKWLLTLQQSHQDLSNLHREAQPSPRVHHKNEARIEHILGRVDAYKAQCCIWTYVSFKQTRAQQ